MGLVNKWRVYVQPFDEFGKYTGAWTEVTDYCLLDSLGSIDRSLDNTDYNIGIYRNSSFTLTLRNDDGKFSDVGLPNSMFKWTRSNSIVKITWTGEEFADSNGLVCGFFPAGNAWLLSETEVFRGLLSDKALSMDLNDQELAFTVLGLETVLTTTFVPIQSMLNFAAATAVTTGTPGSVSFSGAFAGPYKNQPVQFMVSTGGATPNEINASVYSVAVGSTSGSTQATTYYGYSNTSSTFTIEQAPNSSAALNFTGTPSGTLSFGICGGYMLSSIIYQCLNQAAITNLISVSLANINVGQDVTLDDISDLNGMSVWNAVSDLLLLSNSVLYVSLTSGVPTLIVAPRTASVALKYTFYGQGSILGEENIQAVKNFTSGIARTFNYFSWTAKTASLPCTVSGGVATQNTITSVAIQNATSVSKYGAQVKTFNQAYIANSGNWQTILNSLLSEFGNPKQEMDLYTPITPETLALGILDKVALDFPAVNTAASGQQVPICGEAVCGESSLPSYTNYALVETIANNYKIEGVSIDPQTDLICFSIRRI